MLVARLDLGLRGGLAARLAGIELLLDLVEPRLDVGVADLDPHLRGLLLVLARRDQELRRVRAEIVQLGRAGLGEGVLRRLVVLLGLADQRVPLRLRDRLVTDDRDRVAGHTARTTAAARCDRKKKYDP